MSAGALYFTDVVHDLLSYQIAMAIFASVFIVGADERVKHDVFPLEHRGYCAA
jgi:hypothetical protein